MPSSGRLSAGYGGSRYRDTVVGNLYAHERQTDELNSIANLKADPGYTGGIAAIAYSDLVGMGANVDQFDTLTSELFASGKVRAHDTWVSISPNGFVTLGRNYTPDGYAPNGRIDEAGTYIINLEEFINRPSDQCFVGSAQVTTSEGLRGIFTVHVGDKVLAFDPSADGGRGALVPRRVTAVHRSEVRHVLDVFGLGVTPGHVTLCGDGPHAGSFRPIMDILLSDGAVVNEDGSLRRLSTNAAVGSHDDAPVHIVLVRPDAAVDGVDAMVANETGSVRTGTRLVLRDGRELTVGELIAANDWELVTEGEHQGMVRRSPGSEPMPFPWAGKRLPRPEDYVLIKSGLTLDELDADRSGIEPWRPRAAA